MKLNNIISKVAHDLMPPGTIIERMVDNKYCNMIAGKIFTVEDRSDIRIFVKESSYSLCPENFRVIK